MKQLALSKKGVHFRGDARRSTQQPSSHSERQALPCGRLTVQPMPQNELLDLV